MKLLRLAPAKFIHFGTTREIMKLMATGIEDYTVLGWNRKVGSSINRNIAGYNSILSAKATIGKECYLEVSYVHSAATIGDNVLLSYVDIHNESIPSNVVLHGLKQKDGRFVVRIYGVLDNPKGELHKGCTFLGGTLEKFLVKNGINEEELWTGDNRSLWMANLYPACSTISEAVAAALNIYALAHGEGDVETWRNATRKSLCSGFNEADPYAIIQWDKRMRELVQMDRLSKLISKGEPARLAKEILQTKKLSKIQLEWLEKHIARVDFSEAMRIYYYVGTALGGADGDRYVSECFRTIQQTILQSAMDKLRFNEKCKIVC